MITKGEPAMKKSKIIGVIVSFGIVFLVSGLLMGEAVGGGTAPLYHA